MPEIDRVNCVIEAFFEASGHEKVEALSHVLERCLRMAKMHSYETESANGRRYVSKMENGDFIKSVEALEAEIKDYVGKFASDDTRPDRQEMKEKFKSFALRTMLARRSTYPLTNPNPLRPPFTVEEALHNDDDVHSFAIFDTIADGIQALCPALYQLAADGAWDTHEVGKGEAPDAGSGPE